MGGTFSRSRSSPTPSSDNLHGSIESRQRRHSEPSAVDVQRKIFPQPYLVGRCPLDRIRNGEQSSDWHSQGFRKLSREANHDSNIRCEPARDAPSSSLDSWQGIARQEIVELLKIKVEGVRYCRQIVDRQYSSKSRTKLCRFVDQRATEAEHYRRIPRI